MRKIINCLLIVLVIGFITGCASGRGKRNVGVGVSKTIGQKPSLSVGASRNINR